MPPAKKGSAAGDPSSAHLADIPLVYLLERSQWTDFKRALNNCGLTWNLPDWMMTIVYKGDDWAEIVKTKKKELEAVFEPPTKELGDVKLDVGKASTTFMNILGYPKSLGEYIQPSPIFCNLKKLEYEPEGKLPARQKFWTWFVSALHGPGTTPGPFYYLTKQMPMYDIAHLFKKLYKQLEVITICSLDDEVYGVTHLDFDPNKQDLFAYIEDLRRAMRRLEDLNERLPDHGRVIFSEAYLRTRLIRAARQVPMFKSMIEQMITQPPDVWSVIGIDELTAKFEAVRSNDISFVPKRTPMGPIDNDVVTANLVTQKYKEKNNKQKEKTCHDFCRTGQCTRTGCPYVHKNTTAPEKSTSARVAAPPVPAAAPAAPNSQEEKRPQRTCFKCGAPDHMPKDCKFVGKCDWCAKNGHKEEVCRAKKSGVPRIMSVDAADGVSVRANFLRVCDPPPPCC